MTGFTIYRNPSDYPGKFVTRKWQNVNGWNLSIDPPVAIEDTLEKARSWVPQELARIPRHPSDDPAIVETWI